MAKKYSILYFERSVEMTKPSSTVLVYKIPYEDIKPKKYNFEIPNKFIVYILFGKNNAGKDAVYVGKSKNGLANRPTAHTDKYDNWTTCFVLTQFRERTFFNDGTIQYLEDKLNKRINQLGTYLNTTEITTAGTANKSDEEDCDDYLEEVFDMLLILGLDLYTVEEKSEKTPAKVPDINTADNNIQTVVPDGEYYLKRTRTKNGNDAVDARMRVEKGKFIVLQGSIVNRRTRPSMTSSIEKIRQSDHVKDGVVQKEVPFDSPSSAGSFVIGASCDGWINWKNKDGKLIDIYRKNNT